MLGLTHEPKICFVRIPQILYRPEPRFNEGKGFLLPLGKLFFIRRSEAHLGDLKILLRGGTRGILSLLFDYMQPYDSRTRTVLVLERNNVLAY